MLDEQRYAVNVVSLHREVILGVTMHAVMQALVFAAADQCEPSDAPASAMCNAVAGASATAILAPALQECSSSVRWGSRQ